MEQLRWSSLEIQLEDLVGILDKGMLRWSSQAGGKEEDLIEM